MSSLDRAAESRFAVRPVRRFAAACLASVVVGAVVVGCQGPSPTPPPNRGSSGGRMDPSRDAASEIGSDNLRSQDLVVATDQMARSIAARPDINNPQSPPRIFVGPIENKTSQPHQNLQVFLARLQSQLGQSGVRHGIEFIVPSQRVRDARALEYGAYEAQAYQSNADYMLACEVYDLPHLGTNYYFLDYQLIQLRETNTGPNQGAGSVVWFGSYEVKFQ